MAEKLESSYADTAKNETASSSPWFQVGVGVVMIVMLLVASAVVGQLEPKPKSPPATPAAAATPAPAAAEPSTSTSTSTPAPVAAEAPAPSPEKPAAPAPTEVVATEIKEIKSRLEGLSTQVKGIQGTVVEPLTEKVNKLDGHVSDLGKKIEGLGADIAALKQQVVTIAAAKAPKSDDVPKASLETSEADVDMGEAITLFKQAKYKDALDRFRKLTDTDAKDARPWYFAAISSGLVTQNWTGGEAVTYVKKGVEREKAGSPAAEKIDAVFADLSAHTGKEWLSYYRKTAK